MAVKTKLRSVLEQSGPAQPTQTSEDEVQISHPELKASLSTAQGNQTDAVSDNTGHEHVTAKLWITKELDVMKQEIAKLWRVVQDTQKSTKSVCDCS